MAEHNNLVECAVAEVDALWKKVGGTAGVMSLVAKGISAALPFVAFALFGFSFADLFCLKLLQDIMGPFDAPFASLLLLLRFSYFLTHVLTMCVGYVSSFFFMITISKACRESFLIPFIGVAAQIAIYIFLTGSRLVWRLLNGHAPGRYELFVLALVAGKAAYLFWLNSRYTAFLEAMKEDAEVAAETENIAHEADHKNDQEAAEENDKEGAEEDDQSEERVEPEVASESGSTDWEMD